MLDEGPAYQKVCQTTPCNRTTSLNIDPFNIIFYEIVDDRKWKPLQEELHCIRL